MVGGSESNVWKLYESIMCVYFDMEEIIKQAVYLQGAYEMCIRDRLYSPGTRTGLIAELQMMQKSLTGRDRNPVSYTHLDVYKRQAAGDGTGTGRAENRERAEEIVSASDDYAASVCRCV